MYSLMSVEQGTEALESPWVVHSTARYMACQVCEEGALVWEEAEQVSECNSCGSVYEGRVYSAY